MLKHKATFTEEKKYRLLKSVHMIGVLAEIIKVEYTCDLVDTRFKQPSTNNHAKRILESTNQIQKDLAFQFKCMSRDELTYEHALQLHRLLDHFIDLGIERTTEFMDLVEKGKAEQQEGEQAA